MTKTYTAKQAEVQMSNLTYEQAAAQLKISIPHLRKLLRDNDIERFSDAPRAPYVITEKTIKVLQQARKSRARAPIRCEPCKHQPKKLCASCKRPQCIRDYRKTRHGLPAAKCKDCENKRKRLTKCQSAHTAHNQKPASTKNL